MIDRLRFTAACTLASFLCGSTALAQASPAPNPDPSSLDASPKAPPTRTVVFVPDNPAARLEFRGIALVEGVWKDGWIPVCTGGCAGALPLAERYRVNGPKIRQSRLFPIGPGPTPLHLEAKTGSAGGYGLGIAGLSIGATAVPIGVFVWGFAGFCIGDGGVSCPDPEPQRTIGILTTIVGAATLVTGIVLMVRNRTIVTGDEPRVD